MGQSGSQVFSLSSFLHQNQIHKGNYTFTDSRIDNATIKLHFYSVDENGAPGPELLAKDLIVNLKKGVIKHRFSVADYDLIFPKNGLFVAYEKLLIDNNKTGTKYQPYVLYNFVERAFFLHLCVWKMDEVKC